MALLSETGHFMSIDPEDDACVALHKKVGKQEICVVRTNAARDVVVDEQPKEEKGDLSEVERNYVYALANSHFIHSHINICILFFISTCSKKFQKFQDKKMRINQNTIKELEEAKAQGLLHETLLDRRSKMKADRYCK